MGQTAAGTAAGARCSRCSAAVRPGAPWCTQCYAPAGAAAPSAVPEQRPVGSAIVAEPVVPAACTAQLAATTTHPAEHPTEHEHPTGLPTGTWPCSTCATANDLALASCAGCGTPFLAAARATPPRIVLPVVGDLLALSPGRRTALAVGVVVALVLLSALVALLLA